MLFNSLTFTIFLPTVFILYWFVFNKRLLYQNLFLLIVSYFFYGWWDWRFLFLIFLSSLVDYIVGLRLATTENPTHRKLLLGVSLAVNLGALGVFKYYNFFTDSLIALFEQAGININLTTLNVILPVGISFYTFQTLSYSIDVYKRQLEPTRNIVTFFAFVSFFPQLVAGPIERASALLPQFERTRHFDYTNAKAGLKLVLWGAFKKIFIADSLAAQVNNIFANSDNLPGSILVLGAIFFAFQIYCDFSGYSDIAIGTAKLFDFSLMTNFAMPYFARDPAEFWRRWHISLSTWFRDYVFIPLGGSRVSKTRQILNIIITFTVSGLWHGANWTFVIWGFLNGIYYLPLLLLNRQNANKSNDLQFRLIPSLAELWGMVSTFTLITFAWIFFRAESLSAALTYLQGIFSPSLFANPGSGRLIYLLPILFLLIFEWITSRKLSSAANPLEISGSLPMALRWGFYLILSLAIVTAFQEEQSFIYFQF